MKSGLRVHRKYELFKGTNIMNHLQRIENALQLKATDRLPFGFWKHFPNEDRSPRRLAEMMLALQKQLDLDFIKYMPYGLYSVVDWGVRLKVFEGFLDPPIQADYFSSKRILSKDTGIVSVIIRLPSFRMTMFLSQLVLSSSGKSLRK